MTSFEQRCREAHEAYRAAETARETALKIFLKAQDAYQVHCENATCAFDQWKKTTAPVGGRYR